MPQFDGLADVDAVVIEIDLLRRDVTIYRHVSHEAASADGRGYRQQTVIEIPELVSATEPLVTQLARFVDLVRGELDADAERASILPAHRLVDQVLEQSKAVDVHSPGAHGPGAHGPVSGGASVPAQSDDRLVGAANRG